MRRLLLSTLASGLASLSLVIVAHAAPLSVEKPMAAALWVNTGSGGGIGGVGAGPGVGAVGSGGFAGGIGAHSGATSPFGGGIGGAGAYPGGKVNRPGPSVTWYPPEYSAKKQRSADQSCQWLYQKAKNTGTRYWRSRYNSCIAMR